MTSTATKKIYSFITLLMFFVAFSNAQSRQPVNSVIGDISFAKKFGHLPVASTNENLRIRTHLAYVENLLRQKNVSNLSPALQLKRTHLLDLLHDYWTKGIFPRNYDYKDQRRPCFIDKDGRICAVGYLIEQTTSRQVAENINSKYKYEYILAMDDKLVDNWINNSGLSKKECAMIQPSYGPPPCNGNKVWACRTSNCVYECKCVPVNNVAKWQASGHPCGANGNGNLTMVSNGDLILSTEQPQKGSLKIFDMTGRLIKTIAGKKFDEGIHEVNLNTNNMNPGIYRLRMESEGVLQTRKFIVMK